MMFVKMRYLLKFTTNKNKLTIFFLTLFCMLSLAKLESVCDLELLVLELKQDLEDNGILDCLRYFNKYNIELSNLPMA